LGVTLVARESDLLLGVTGDQEKLFGWVGIEKGRARVTSMTLEPETEKTHPSNQVLYMEN